MATAAVDGVSGDARDPRHVLVVLGGGWLGAECAASGLSADGLIATLAEHGFVGHRATGAAEALATLRARPIGAVILDLAMAPAESFSTYEALRSPDLSLPCLLLSDPRQPVTVQQASALDRLDELVRVDETCTAELILLYLRALLLRRYPGFACSPWERPADRAPAADGRRARRELICVFSAKGGTGKTTIACNLATALGLERKRRVVLVDGDLYFGDVDVTIGLPSGQDGRRRSLLTAVEALHIPAGPWTEESAAALDAFDSKLLDEILHRHASGVRVLPTPPRPEMAEGIHPSVFARAVDLCAREFDYTIVDLRSAYSETEIQLLDSATRIVVVLKPEMSCLRNTTLFLDYAEQFGWQDKLLFVLNRADSNRFTRISQAAVERHLGMTVIPVVSSGTVPQAASEGRCVIEAYPSSRVAESLHRLVDAVDGEAPSAGSAGRGLRKLLPGRLVPGRGVGSATS